MISINLHALLILVAGGVLLTMGDVIFLYWKGHTTNILYMSGFALYAFALVFLIKAYKYEHLAVAASILDISNVLMLVFISWLFFNQSITAIQGVGVFFATIAFILLEIG
jgi:multidrug transporter EmrE-like cation transporter